MFENYFSFLQSQRAEFSNQHFHDETPQKIAFDMQMELDLETPEQPKYDENVILRKKQPVKPKKESPKKETSSKGEVVIDQNAKEYNKPETKNFRRIDKTKMNGIEWPIKSTN
jgi:hypothetical protein